MNWMKSRMPQRLLASWQEGRPLQWLLARRQQGRPLQLLVALPLGMLLGRALVGLLAGCLVVAVVSLLSRMRRPAH